MYESRYPYIPNQQMQQGSSMGQMNQMNQIQQRLPMSQMNGMDQMNRFNQIPMQTPIQQRFSFNPMTRIQVQPPMQGSVQSQNDVSSVPSFEYSLDSVDSRESNLKFEIHKLLLAKLPLFFVIRKLEN